METPAANCSAPIAHCDADCDYDPFDDGPRDSMGWTKKERVRRMQSEERAKAWTLWFNHKGRLRTLRSHVRQASKLLTEEEISEWQHLKSLIVARQTSESP